MDDSLEVEVELATDVATQDALRAMAMLTLADSIEVRADRQGPCPAVRLTRKEWDLVVYALRHTADSDN